MFGKVNSGVFPVKPLFAAFLIIAVGLLAYVNTLHAPVIFDEKRFIFDNPYVKDPGNPVDILLKTPEWFRTNTAVEASLWYKNVVSRYVAFSTFALNYRFHGEQVEGYHAVNLTIHILNALLLSLTVLLLFQTPAMQGSSLQRRSGFIAFFSGLFFVAHPVHTLAVTYIMERPILLATFFYLLTIALYARWRIAEEAVSSAGADGTAPTGAGLRNNTRTVMYWGAVIAAVLAMKSRENAFTLPLMIALFETLFFRGAVRKRVLILLPFLLTMLIIPLSTGMLIQKGVLVSDPEGLRGFVGTPWQYLINQFRVIITYYRLLFYPADLLLIYEYPVRESLLHPELLVSLLFHLFMIAFSLFLLKRSRSSDPSLRVLTYGILWFYVTLSVESTLVPLSSLIFEYRVYLPSVGFLVLIVTAIFMAGERSALRRWLPVPLAVLVVCTAYAAYARNAIMSDEVLLWEDTVRKTPNNSRAHNNLGNFYLQKGKYVEAEREFQAGVRLQPDNMNPRRNLIRAYILQGKITEAREAFAASLGPGAAATADGYMYFGSMLREAGFIREAVTVFQEASALQPDRPDIHYELATTFYNAKEYSRAIREYGELIRMAPDNVEAHNNLGGVYAQLGQYDLAAKELRMVLALHPELEDARYNLRIVTELQGQRRSRK